MKTENTDTFECLTQTLTHKSVMAYLQQMSGQEKKHDVIEVDHSYAKPWNRHPDSMIRAKAAKFLFMKNFPRHFMRRQYNNDNDNYIDIETVDQKPTLPILNTTNYEQSFKTIHNESDNSNELPQPVKNGWTTQMNKLWTKAMKILHSDRLARLSYEGQVNEAILKRNLTDRSANKFRHLFASSAWDLKLVSWLNNTLNEYVGPLFLASYHESMQILRVKVCGCCKLLNKYN
jgi:regulatory NSL complex subunit 3